MAKFEWIPMAENRPIGTEDYLVVDEYGTMAVGFWVEEKQAWDSLSFGWLENRDDPPFGIGKVVAWMRLPPPYKGCESKK